jgi:uncharacterized membrane protein AbrB (regulator of aidB expression)
MWSLIIPIGIAIVLAIALYAVLRRPVPAALIAATLVAIGLQVWVRLELGYWDQFWPIALVVSFVYFSGAALAILFAWRYLAKRRKA